MATEAPIPRHETIKNAVDLQGLNDFKSWKPVREGAIIATSTRESCAGVTVFLLGNPKLSDPEDHLWFFPEGTLETSLGPVNRYHSCETLRSVNLNAIGERYWKIWEKQGHNFLDTLRTS